MSETMKAAVFMGEGRLDLEDRPIPRIEEDNDVVIQVGALGICGSDLHMLHVPPGHPAKIGAVLGHEFSGRVHAIGGSVADLEIGDHVVIDPNAPCGECDSCRKGIPNACIKLFNTSGVPGFPNSIGVFQDGGMAEFCKVPARSVYKISKSVPMVTASLTEPLACAVHGIRKVRPKVGETAVVLGAGPIGLLFISLLKAEGVSKIIVSEPVDLRQKAAIGCGADVVINPLEKNAVEAIKEENNGAGADIVIESAGALMETAVLAAGTAGRVLLFGMNESVKPEIPAGEIIRKELVIFGNYMTQYTFSAAVKILEEGVLPVDQIVTHTMPLSKVHDALKVLNEGKGIKAVLVCNDF